jgi:signal transduction histidine kinase
VRSAPAVETEAPRSKTVDAPDLLDALLSVLVHDLRNSLGVVLANAHFIAGSNEMSAEAVAATGDILAASDSMSRMILDALEVRKSTNGTLRVRPDEIDLPELILGVCRAASGRADLQSLRVTTRLDEENRIVRADGELLRRVIENLVDNAIKYTQPGGTIRIESTVSGDAIEVRVCDTGPCVPEALREDVFGARNQLRRADGGHTRQIHGIGLCFCGLAVEAHGGQIWVDTNESNECVFCFRIPGVAVSSTEAKVA